MSSAVSRSTEDPDMGEPAWEIARLFPNQGAWSEEDYLELNSNKLIEFSEGNIEVLTMPTTSHQLIVLFLYRALEAFVAAGDLGTVLVAALRVRLWAGKYREPDIVFMRRGNAARIGEQFWEGADLVMEVVSDSADGRQRDLVIKRAEYARARIPEYWIISPQDRRITVLRLEGNNYVVHGEFGEDTKASSALLPGFAVDVTEVLAAGKIEEGN